MSVVRHIVDGTPWPRGYSGPGVAGLQPGDVADVSDEIAVYLTTTFPLHFVVVAAPETLPPADPSPSATTSVAPRRKPR